MVPEINFDVMFQEVKANQARLDACVRHHFPTWPPVPLPINCRVDCTRCGGNMPALQVYAYVRGYIAAGGNGNHIIPGWNGSNDSD